MTNPKKWFEHTGNYLSNDVWEIRSEDLPKPKAMWIGFLRIVMLTWKGFHEDNCLLRASALTFYSLLSIVPVAAMAFGIAKGFGYQRRLERQVLEQIPGQEEVLKEVVNSAYRFLENTEGGLVAGVGVVVLFWSVIKVLNHIEEAFNRIWLVENPRTPIRKLTDYLSIVLIGPFLVILSSSVTVFITTRITDIAAKFELLDTVSQPLFASLKLLPYALVWLLFTLVYVLMPNTRVRIGPAFMGGIIAGTVFQIVQWGYISFQVGVARYNAIYGSFAALPLFLIWLQVSWTVVLLGAEIAYAGQNNGNTEFKHIDRPDSVYLHRLLSLLAARIMVHRFSAGEPPLTADDLSRLMELPIARVRKVLDDLVAGGVFSTTPSVVPEVPAYQPAVDTDLLTVHYVIDRLDRNGTNVLPFPKGPEFEALSAILESFKQTMSTSGANKRLKEI